MSDRVILGVDLARRSKCGRSYAVVVLNETRGTVERFPSISRFRLIRMIKRLKPEIVASDNIYELGNDKGRGDGSLAEFLRELPSRTKLVQVTGGVRRQPLNRLAKRLRITFNRFNPLDEANACALLARDGVGDEVLFFRDKTQIKVSRARSLGKGGWSQKRYGRRVHAAVKERTEEIKDILRESGLKYELSVKKGFGGYVSAIFLVDAKRDDIHISSGRSGDVQVKVSPLERERIEFVQQRNPPRRRYIIVGIDPGTTTGVAILDLNGNLIELSSSRTRTPAELIETIAEAGRPLIVASDVKPVPSGVDKIKRAFNAILHEPQESLAVDIKIALTKSFEYRNDHERDALAAALDAYNSHKAKFKQIEKKTPPGVDVDEVKARVLRGSKIDAAISSLLTDKRVDKPVSDRVEEEKVDEKVVELRSDLKSAYERIDLLKKYIEELELKIRDKETEIEDLRAEIRMILSHERRMALRSKELKRRDSEIKRLKRVIWELKEENKMLLSRIEHLKSVRKQEMRGERLPLKVIDSFNRNAIMRSMEEYGIRKGDILLFKDASGGGESTVRMLGEIGIKAVVYLGEMSHMAADAFIELGIPAFRADELSIKMSDEIAVVDAKLFEMKMEEWRKEYGLLMKKQRERWVEELVDQYRMERERENR